MHIVSRGDWLQKLKNIKVENNGAVVYGWHSLIIHKKCNVSISQRVQNDGNARKMSTVRPNKATKNRRGIRACSDVVFLDFWCSFADIFIFKLRYKPCGLQYFEIFGNFKVVCGFLMLFCAVFICNSGGFCSICTLSNYAPFKNNKGI